MLAGFFLPAFFAMRLGLGVLGGVLDVANALLDLALDLLGNALGLLAAVVGQLAHLLLHLAGDVLGRAFDVMLVHADLLSLFVKDVDAVPRVARGVPPGVPFDAAGLFRLVVLPRK